MIYDVRFNKVAFSLRKKRLKINMITLFKNRKVAKKRTGENFPVQISLVDMLKLTA